jgi:peptidoglycan/xylan/chitin deacetylase (PgdA/CDA1 family)
MYHDVVDVRDRGRSGFAGRAPGTYKLDRPLFEHHLEAFAAAGRSPSSVADIRGQPREPLPRTARPLYLTFDDGGSSALNIGERLTAYGWVGHFFIPVDFIGRAGFLDKASIAGLAAMGHVIGTHSCSHTVPMTRLPDGHLLEEWRRSVAVLNEITEGSVFAGSVPGGYWSKRLVRAAASAGVETLFVSDPVASIRKIEGCLVIGRYAIRAGTSPEAAACLASGDLVPRLRQLARWKVKGAAKALSGDAYRSLRKAVLERG